MFYLFLETYRRVGERILKYYETMVYCDIEDIEDISNKYYFSNIFLP